MIDEIVACLDGSAQAESILPYARGVAMGIGAPLTLLGVIESERTETAAKRYLNVLSDHLQR